MYDFYNTTDPLLNGYMPEAYRDLTPEQQEEVATTTALCGCGTYALAFILGILMCALFGSCTTPKVVTVEHVRTDTVRITQMQRDSIYQHDSIYVRERTQGDTVILEVDRWHTAYRDRVRTDTAYISRRDSVPVPYPVDRPVPAELSGWQNFQIWLGRLVLLALALCAVVFVFRWWLKQKKVI